MEFNSGFKGLK